MSAAVTIAGASARILVRHLVRASGGRRRAIALAVGVLAVGVVVNVLVHRFATTHLGVVLDADDSAGTRLAWSALVGSMLATAPVVAAGALTVIAPSSLLRPSAVLAGASRAALVTGELVPFLVLVAAVVGLGGAGPLWFVAERQPLPVAAFPVLALTATGLAFSAIAVHGLVLLGARSVRMGSVPARTLAAVATFGVLGAVHADVIGAALDARPSAVVVLTDLVWGGAGAMSTARAGVGSAALLVGATTAVLAVRAGERGGGTLDAIRSRPLFTRWGRGPLLAAAASMLRHPVVQTTLVGDVALVALLVVAVRTGAFPASVAHTAAALLFAALAETTAGRASPWAWVRRLAGQSPSRVVRGQFVGTLPVGGVLTTVAVLAIGPGGPTTDWPEPVPLAVARALVLFVAMSALAYLAGVVLPYSDAAPTAIIGTSLLAIGLEAVALTVVQFARSALPQGTGLDPALEICLGVIALVASSHLVGRRWAGDA